MSLHVALSVSALAASATLFLSGPSRALAAIPLAASALEVAMALGALHVSIPRVPLAAVLGLALAVPGLLAWLRTGAKTAASAAAIVALVGALQVLSALGDRL